MKRLRLQGLVLAAIWLSLATSQAQTPVMPLGSGTAGDPYRVSTLSHLAWMSTNCTGTFASATYSLQNDIDAQATTNWYGGAGFNPIGDSAHPFSGKFHGNGHTIRKLTIKRPTASYVGLFGSTSGAGFEISGLGLVNGSVEGSVYVGGLIGCNNSGTVNNCYSTGPVSGVAYVGGLVGFNQFGELKRSYATGPVSGQPYVGGLIGKNISGTVGNCYATGPVSGTYHCGGLVGFIFYGAVSGSYATGPVSGDMQVGGLAGCSEYGAVGDSYATGSASANQEVGGLIGIIFSGTVSRCYSTGPVPGNYIVGGLIGHVNSGTVNGSYWDTNTSGQATSAGGTGKSTAEMTAWETFAGWDFDSIWGLKDVSYPDLQDFTTFKLIYSAGAHGAVTGWSNQVANIGARGLPATAVPDVGYHFTGWSDGLVTTMRVDADVYKDVDVEAGFALNVITVITDRASVTVPEGGKTNLLVKLSAQPLEDVEIEVAQTAGDKDISVSHGKPLVFTTANWDVDQAVTLAAAEDNDDNANGTAIITCEGKEAAQAVVTATEADDDFTLAVSSLYGTVSRVPETTYYDNGTVVTLTATPDISCFFRDWSGNLTGTNNPATITMNGIKSVAANYEPFKPEVLPPRASGKKRFTARWKWVEGGAPEGELSVASNAVFSRFVPGYEERYVHNTAECAVTNLISGRDYWYRIRRIMPDATVSAWSSGMKVRTGKGMPAFKHLLSDVPVAKGISQDFAASSLFSGVGELKVKSSNTNAVKAGISAGVLTLQYLWKDTATAAKVTLTLTHPVTGYKAFYGATVSRATGSVAIVGNSALTNAGSVVAQEVNLENRTGGMVYGVRLRAKGLDQAVWLINRTGLDPVSQAAIREIPCVWPAGSQMVARLVYNVAYKKQAKTRPVTYGAWAIMTPMNGALPVNEKMTITQRDVYDGLWLLGLPANRNRLYSVYQSDDAGATWTPNVPAIRATANYLMWLDTDEGAPPTRLYRVVDAGL